METESKDWYSAIEDTKPDDNGSAVKICLRRAGSETDEFVSRHVFGDADAMYHFTIDRLRELNTAV